MTSPTKGALALLAVVLLLLCALFWFYRSGTPSTRTARTQSQAFSIQILGNYNRVYVVFGADMQNTDNVLLLGNHRVRTIVVIKCPVKVVFRGNQNEVIIDSALRKFVKVEDRGKSNAYIFSD